jgi:hypothetical protein
MLCFAPSRRPISVNRPEPARLLTRHSAESRAAATSVSISRLRGTALASTSATRLRLRRPE